MLREDEEIPRGVQERTPGEQVDSSDVVLSEISRSTGIGKYRGGQSKGDWGGPRERQGAPKGPNAKIRRCQDDPMRVPRAKVVKSEELGGLGGLGGGKKAHGSGKGS